MCWTRTHVNVCNQDRTENEILLYFISDCSCDRDVKTKKLPNDTWILFNLHFFFTHTVCVCVTSHISLLYNPITNFHANILPLCSAFSLTRVSLIHINRRKDVERKGRSHREKEGIPLFRLILQASTLALRGSRRWEGDGNELPRVMSSASPPFLFSFCTSSSSLCV